MTFVTQAEDGEQWRIGIVEDRGYIALMARDLSDYRSEVQQVRRLFFLAFPVCLLIIGIGGWFGARRAMRPVELIANTASRVTARGLDQRIPKDAHDYAELSHLVDVLNFNIEFFAKSKIHPQQVFCPKLSFITTSTASYFNNTVNWFLARLRFITLVRNKLSGSIFKHLFLLLQLFNFSFCELT